jgi:UDP-glucose 4-epimerase
VVPARARLVVTGAGGYLGGRVVAAAHGDGRFLVRSVVRKPTTWLTGEVVQVKDLAADALSALEGASSVLHLAGANELIAARHPDGALASTVAASRAVGAACAAAKVRRVVYVSTVHVYGAALLPGAVVDEGTLPQPRHPYAIARLASEHSIAAAAGTTEVVIMRLTNGVGAPAHRAVDRWSLVANDLCRQAAAGGPLVLRSPAQWRDFVALSDVVRILLDAAAGEVPAGTYNLGSGRCITVAQLAELVATEANVLGCGSVDIEAPPAVPEEPYQVSVERLAAAGARASTPLREAVAETIRFCLESARVAGR